VTDPCAAYGYKTGDRRRRSDEDPAKFIKRVIKYAPEVIAKCEGDLPAVALVFGIQLPMLEDLVTVHKRTLGRALTKARALASARQSESEKDVIAAKAELVKEIKDQDRRLKRKSWSKDPDKRAADIKDALMVSLVENDGDVAETSLCLNVPIAEINELLDADTDIQSARDEGLRVQATKAESQAFKKAQMGDNAMIKLLLTNLSGDRWSERQQVDVRKIGFAPPEDKEDDAVSVLQLVKGENGDA